MDFSKLFGRAQITKSGVEAKRNQPPHRICFATTHANQPKRSASGYVGAFNVPFFDTVGKIFEQDTGLELFESKGQYGGYWRSIQTEEEFEQIVAWKKRQGTRLFLRDCLDLSVAMDTNFTDNQSMGYTVLGRHEALAKSDQDEASIQVLVDHYVEAIADLPGYCDAKVICAVPGRPGKAFDLPTILAQRIAEARSLTDVTERFSFTGTKDSIKALGVDQKWEAWEAAGLSFAPKLEGDPAVILIDDKYQSGMTIQFVASKLLDVGASKVFGLCAVKTLRDTDNQ